VFDVAGNDELHAILWRLPLSHMTIQVTPLCTHRRTSRWPIRGAASDRSACPASHRHTVSGRRSGES
jgi:hypothetical protein